MLLLLGFDPFLLQVADPWYTSGVGNLQPLTLNPCVVAVKTFSEGQSH